MTTNQRLVLRVLFGRCAVLAAAMFLLGCATQQQVKDIVSDSNLASVSSDLGLGDADPQKPGGSGTAWREASAKIETFIAAHPDEKPTIAALRVRQAVMLLNNRQYNLAAAAFDQANLVDLHSSRDRALKQLAKDLIWWYETAGDSTVSADTPTGSQALTNITRVVSNLKTPADEGVRDWLAALRAWIALKMANDARGSDRARMFMEDAINSYSSMLPPGETATWLQQPKWPPAGMSLETAISASNRRRFRAEALIDGAQKAMKANNITNPQIKDAFFRERLK